MPDLSPSLLELETVARVAIGGRCIGCGESDCPGCWNPASVTPWPEPPQHGGAAYRRGCRCNECKAWNCDRSRRGREDRTRRGRENPELIPHGTITGYREWSCRCPRCTAVNAQVCGEYYLRTCDRSLSGGADA